MPWQVPRAWFCLYPVRRLAMLAFLEILNLTKRLVTGISEGVWPTAIPLIDCQHKCELHVDSPQKRTMWPLSLAFYSKSSISYLLVILLDPSICLHLDRLSFYRPLKVSGGRPSSTQLRLNSISRSCSSSEAESTRWWIKIFSSATTELVESYVSWLWFKKRVTHGLQNCSKAEQERSWHLGCFPLINGNLSVLLASLGSACFVLTSAHVSCLTQSGGSTWQPCFQEACLWQGGEKGNPWNPPGKRKNNKTEVPTGVFFLTRCHKMFLPRLDPLPVLLKVLSY